MNSNRTSEAVEDLPRWARDMVKTCLIADYGTDTAKALGAIAEKYKRMEKALEFCASHPYLGAIANNAATEALSFDPLTPPL